MATVYSRTEALSQNSRLVGYAYNVLKEAFYSEKSAFILLVDYELLTINPAKMMSLIYQFLGEPPFEHDFENVQYQEPERVKTSPSKRKSSNRGLKNSLVLF